VKKFLTVILVITLALSMTLTACGSRSRPSEGQNIGEKLLSSDSSSTTTKAPPLTETTREEESNQVSFQEFDIKTLFHLDFDESIERVFTFHEGMAAIYYYDPDNPYGLVWYYVGYIDTNGSLVIPMEIPYSNHEIYEDGIPNFSEGLVRANAFLDFPFDFSYGFYDKTGDLVIPFQFAYINDFSEGLAPVAFYDETSGEYTWSIINTSGEVVIETDYTYIGRFSDGLAVFGISDGTRYGSKYGYIDTSGNVVIPPVYNHARDFSDGLAAVTEGHWSESEWGYINISGELIVPYGYNSAWDFTDGIAAVSMGDDTFGFIDKEGNAITPLDFDIDLNGRFFGPDFTPPALYNGLVALITGDWEDSTLNYYNSSGELVHSFDEYDFGRGFSEGVAAVRCRDTKLWGYIDMAGNLIVPLEYIYAGDFSEGLAAAATGEGDLEALSWSLLELSVKAS